MPCVHTSLARAFVRQITPAFVAEYGARLGLPSFPAMEATFTMRPDRFFNIAGRTALQHKNTPFRLIADTLSHSSSETSTKGLLGPATPALFTRISMVANRSITELAIACVWAKLVTSTVTTKLRPPVGSK